MNISFNRTCLDIEVYINDEFTFVIDVVDINNLKFEDVYYELKRIITKHLVINHDVELK